MNKIILRIIALPILVGVISCHRVIKLDDNECMVPSTNFKISQFDNVELLLPPNSKLIEKNTDDTEYWAWQTSIGDISLAPVGSAYRNQQTITRQNFCIIKSAEFRFKVYRDAKSIVAISDPFTKNGARISIVIEPIDELSFKNSLAIIESVKYKLR